MDVGPNHREVMFGDILQHSDEWLTSEGWRTIPEEHVGKRVDLPVYMVRRPLNDDSAVRDRKDDRRRSDTDVEFNDVVQQAYEIVGDPAQPFNTGSKVGEFRAKVAMLRMVDRALEALKNWEIHSQSQQGCDELAKALQVLPSLLSNSTDGRKLATQIVLALERLRIVERAHVRQRSEQIIAALSDEPPNKPANIGRCECRWCNRHGELVRVDENLGDGSFSVNVCRACASALGIEEGGVLPQITTEVLHKLRDAGIVAPTCTIGDLLNLRKA